MKICIYGVIRSAFVACLLMNESCIIASSIQEEKNLHLRRRQEEDRIETGGKIPKMLTLVCVIQGLASGHYFQETNKPKLSTFSELKADANDEIFEYMHSIEELEQFTKLSEKLDIVEVRSPMGQLSNFASNIASCARDLSRKEAQNGGYSALKNRNVGIDVSRREEYGKSSIITKIAAKQFMKMEIEEKRAYEFAKVVNDNLLYLVHAEIFGNEIEEYGKSSIITKKRAYELGKEANDNLLKLVHAKIFGNGREEYGKSSVITKITAKQFMNMDIEEKRAYELAKVVNDNLLKLVHAKIFGRYLITMDMMMVIAKIIMN